MTKNLFTVGEEVEDIVVFFDEELAKKWLTFLNKDLDPGQPLATMKTLTFADDEYTGACKALALFNITPASSIEDFNTSTQE